MVECTNGWWSIYISVISVYINLKGEISEKEKQSPKASNLFTYKVPWRNIVFVVQNFSWKSSVTRISDPKDVTFYLKHKLSEILSVQKVTVMWKAIKSPPGWVQRGRRKREEASNGCSL